MNSLSQNSPSLSKRVLEEAWISLLGFYGRSFEAQYGSIGGEQFGLWFAGLITNGVTDEMVGDAVRAVPAEHARRTSHPPNFADFLRLCMNMQQSDSLSEDRAFAEATAAARTWDRHVWSMAAVYHAAIAVGGWSLRQFPEKVTRPKFVEAYRKLIEMERAGEVLAAPPSPESTELKLIAPAQENPAKAQARRQRMIALSSALAELPDHLQRIATDSLKSGTFVAADQLLPSGNAVSAQGRAVLLEFCCNIPVEQQPVTADELLFTEPPAI